MKIFFRLADDKKTVIIKDIDTIKGNMNEEGKKCFIRQSLYCHEEGSL